MLVCKICNLKFKNLGNHILRGHKISIEDYKKEYKIEKVISDDLLKEFKNAHKKYSKNFFAKNGRVGAKITNQKRGAYSAERELKCKWCGHKQKISGGKKEVDKRKFCNKSCATSYNNTHKKTGALNSRSKSEKYLLELIRDNYPGLKILSNDRNLCAPYEIDILIPEIKLAIEWNGISHYKPIYGKDEFIKKQSYDDKKKNICKKEGYILFVIKDLSKFSQKTVRIEFQKLKKVIDSQLKTGLKGFDRVLEEG